jgi:UDP-N-acetylglucosamine 2-epimerase (non-hydrolysing)
VSDFVLKLGTFYQNNKSDLSVYLGDTNTVMGSISSAQYQIPIFHIEGCMRSYDWTMPEEKYRTIIDHLSDRIYAYFEEYKQQGISEGLNPSSIIVTGNIIVDVLNKHYFNKIEKFQFEQNKKLFEKYNLKKKEFIFATAHRRENILDLRGLQNIQKLFANSRYAVLFAAGYRTQAMIKKFGLEFENTLIIDPIGYEELLILVTNSYAVFTDSGTLVEEACVLGIPCIQMRRSTERPQVYDSGGTIKFNPLDQDSAETIREMLIKLDSISSKIWKHNLGDGTASRRIVDDIINLALTKDTFSSHLPESLHLDTTRAYSKENY